MTTFTEQVKEAAGPTLCKIGDFIYKQDHDKLKAQELDPITEEELVEANARYPSGAVITALRQRGLRTSEDLLRKHCLGTCACEREEEAA